MIPKKIHYTWFSKEPFPAEIIKCLDSWKEFLPQYELILWDLEKVKDIENRFLQEALSVKKWAFASDYVRLFALYHFGGIYLDTDVLILKNFDVFLRHKCFIGQENSYHLHERDVVSFLGSHCIGAEKKNKFIGNCLEYYTQRHFIHSTHDIPNALRFDMALLPYIQAVIAKHNGWNWQYGNRLVYENNDFTIYPSQYFDSAIEGKQSYCKHLALGSWREQRKEQPNITLSYKIIWRMEALAKKILGAFGYLMIKYKP